MALLQARKSFFILLDGSFKLFDIFGSSFAEGCLSLAVSLLTLFRGSIYLPEISHDMDWQRCESVKSTHWFPPAFAFLGLGGFLGSWFGPRVLLRRGLDRAGRAIWCRLDLGGGCHIALDVSAISHLLQVPGSGTAQSS